MAKKKEKPFDPNAPLQSENLYTERGGTSFAGMHYEVGKIVLSAIRKLFAKKNERLGERECDQMLQLISGDIRRASMLAVQGKLQQAQKIARNIDYEAAYNKMKSEE